LIRQIVDAYDRIPAHSAVYFSGVAFVERAHPGGGHLQDATARASLVIAEIAWVLPQAATVVVSCNSVDTLDRSETTYLLAQIRKGNAEAANLLFERLQGDLRRLAAYHMKAEQPGHTLQPTALVNEVYIRVFGGESIEWQSRAHFFAVAARHMRHILVDHARKKAAEKRGAGLKVSLSNVEGLARADQDFEALHEALTDLEKLYPGPAGLVELRFFGGLTEQEVAEVLSISLAQVRRDWDFARAWLFNRLGS
jgi:RNA polymerase sigma factor (TIGR02999 family)